MRGVQHDSIKKSFRGVLTPRSPWNDYLTFLQLCGGQSQLVLESTGRLGRFDAQGDWREAKKEEEEADDDDEEEEEEEEEERMTRRINPIGFWGGYEVYDIVMRGFLAPFFLVQVPCHKGLGIATEVLETTNPWSFDEISWCLNNVGKVVRLMPRFEETARGGIKEHVVAQNFTAFFTQHVERLERGEYALNRRIGINRHVRDECSSEAVTEGIRVRVTVIFMPERSHQRAHCYTYQVSIDTTEQFCIRAAKLERRRWKITQADGREEEVEGPGVVGEFPRVFAACPVFTYSSICQCDRVTGKMEGWLAFRVEDDTQRIIQVRVNPFYFDPQRNQC